VLCLSVLNASSSRSYRTNKQPIIYAAPSFDLDFKRPQDLSWPAKNLVHFDHSGQQWTCKKKYLLVFKGTNDHYTRKNLGSLDNGKDVRVTLTEFKSNCGKDDEAHKSCGKGEFSELLLNSTFGLVIRGDTYYSYRFLEVISAGVVPVIFSDKWALPFAEVGGNPVTSSDRFSPHSHKHCVLLPKLFHTASASCSCLISNVHLHLLHVCVRL
jgi:hypothetical protein